MSPGPHGFTFEFFRKFWAVVGPDLCTAVEWFFDHGSFSIGCNSSFIALIPKTLDPKIVSDYRPICLIGSLYKVVTKIIATRLSTVIFDLISDAQTAFLPNRQILDGPFIINELLSRCKKTHQAMVFKVDFTKAYDSIRWDYLEDVLKSFGFGSKWCSWIRGSLNSGMASILVNGSPTSEFQFHCGLKQGDPLAPYLFILIMESLHLSFSRVIDAGIFTGVRIDSSLMISHLFYADDAVFIGEWSQDNLKAAVSLGCSVMKTPFKYLGVMVGGNMSLVKAWDDTVGKLKMRNFFNGIQADERKIAWVKWSKVLAPKKQGGLGVSSYYVLNRVLLIKWELSASHSSTWSSIIKEINVLKDQGVDLISHCKIRVGNGMCTSFWNDFWIGDTQLRYLFPRLYALDSNKESTVADKLQVSITSSFRRAVRGGAEAQQLVHLLDLLGPVILSNMEDRWVWDMNGDGVFRVKDVRNLLDETFLPNDANPTRWIKSVPIKINVFAWKVYLDRLPTRSNLTSRGVAVSSLSCPICNVAHEDTAHLLFSCRLATDVVRLVCRWWNLVWLPLNSYPDWLNWFKSLRLGSKIKEVLEGVFYVTWWHLWSFRNQLLFAPQKPRKDYIFDDIVMRSFTWCLARGKSTFSWDRWLQHPYLISL
ncbi:RNA-directed DNA polymerase, eukaryota [Tanacetum coccineum]